MTRRRHTPAARFGALAMLGALALAPAAARAQTEGEGEGEAPAGGPVVPAAPAEAEAPAAEAPAAEAAAAPARRSKGAPFARVADDEETIYAVQRKAYLADGKLELSPMFAFSFTDRFVQTFAPAASVSYHLAENFGLEVFGAYMFPTESGLTTEILDKGKLTPEIAKLTQMLWAAGVGVQFSPIYGKVQIFGASLGNFSFYIGAGAGVGQTRVQCTPGAKLDPNRGFDPAECPMIEVEAGAEDELRVVYEPASLKVMGSLVGGVRFYFSNSLGLKLEVRDYIFSTRVYRPDMSEPTQRYTDAIRNNIFASIGLSFLFGGVEN
jgi:outer membrane beta-barrel protein